MIAPWVIPAIIAGASAVSKMTDKSGQGNLTSYIQRPTWNPEQQALFEGLFNIVGPGMTNPAPSAPKMSVDTTGQEQSYFNMINELAKSKAAAGQPLSDYGPEFANDYFENSVKPTYMKEYQDIIQPGINKAYAGNFYSSARMEEQSRAAQNLAYQLAKERSTLSYGELDKEREARQQALQNQMQIIEKQGQAGELQRQIEEQKTMENLQRFLMGEEVDGAYNPIFNPYMQFAMQMLGLNPYTYTEASYSETKGAGGISSLFGGIGMGAAMFGGGGK